MRINMLKPKPYSVNFSCQLDVLYSHNSYYELMDINDIRRASINELKIENDSQLTNKIRFYLTEFLSNTNIKKINICFSVDNYNFLIFISKLLRKNTTIKEIVIQFESITKINYIRKKAWLFFIKTVSSKLVRIQSTPFSEASTYMNKLLFKNSNIKEISLCRLRSNILEDFFNILKYILISGMCLNCFNINAEANNLDINQQFFDDISKSERKAEINSLVLEQVNLKLSLVIIKNAYLFKTETIIVRNYFCDLLDPVLKLSINPLNTIKRIIIDYPYWKKECNEMNDNIRKMLNSDNIPKIFIVDSELQMLKDDKKNLYECFNTTLLNRFTLVIIENSLNKDLFLKLLCLLFNKPEDFKCLKIECYKSILKFKNNIFPRIGQLEIDNFNSIASQMKEMYYKYKEENIYYKNTETLRIAFYFSKSTPELNILYFTIFDILIELEMKIITFEMVEFSITELVEFMKRYKNLKSIYINDITINSNGKDVEKIEELFEYSYLINGKIYIKFTKEVDMNDENFQTKLIDLFYIKLRKDNNFIKYHFDNDQSSENNFINFENNNQITKFIESNLIKRKFDCKRKFCKTNIIKFQIDFTAKTSFFPQYFDIQYLFILFSFFKEYQYVLNKIFLKDLKFYEASSTCRMNSMVFETILDNIYRREKEEKILFLTNMIRIGILKRKYQRYLRLHNISKI